MFDKFPIDPYVKKDKQLIKVVKEIKSKYKTFIITNGTKRQVIHKLKLLGLVPSDFDPLVCCYDHNWAKPEPAPFLYVLGKLNVLPQEVLYVGDRVDVDIEGANQVGMKTLLIGRQSELATYCCEAVYDILNIL